MAKSSKNDESETREFTEEEINRLVQFFNVLIEIDQAEKARQRRLAGEPKGFSMPGEGRDCSLCKRYLPGEDGWYDKWGFKCMNC